MKNNNTISELFYIKATDLDHFMDSRGYRLHHSATTRCYVSRKSEMRRVETYKGRFGEGYIVYTPNWRSTNYSYIVYYIKKEV